MESSSNHYYNSNVIAPFIMKTYQMVNDPSTDFLITWGKANNSFIVVEPSEFSQRILPVFFKHNNYSSFVRQLNTYGFKKVDPDRCEFAHEHFLRGQEHLLSNIARRKYNSTRSSISCMKNEDIDDEEIMMEIRRLKEEQNALERELQGMNKRLEVTEKRPQQMMSFLCKVVEDPDSLNRMMHDKHSNMQLQIGEVIKKRRLMLSSAAASSSCSSYGLAASSSVKIEEDEDEGFVEIERFRCSPIETYQQSWWDDRMTQQTYGSSGGDHTPFGTVPGSGMVVAPPGTGSISGGGGEIGSVQVSYGGTQIGASPRPAYPFSLLEGGF